MEALDYFGNVKKKKNSSKRASPKSFGFTLNEGNNNVVITLFFAHFSRNLLHAFFIITTLRIMRFRLAEN